MRRIVTVFVTLCLLTIAVPAQADSISGSWRGYTDIEAGVFELGMNAMFLLRYSSTSQDVAGAGEETVEATTSGLDVAGTAGLSPRFFLAKNWSLGAHLNGIFRSRSITTDVDGNETEESSSDVGFLGLLTTDYYIGVGNNFFFKPGIGVGGFFGSRSVPVEGMDNLTESQGWSGFAVLVDLGFVFYASQSWNLKAGVNVLPLIGSVSPDEGESQSFVEVDMGFNVGFGYSF